MRRTEEYGESETQVATTRFSKFESPLPCMLKPPNFQRAPQENFICLHCGQEVFSNGYTNHCPACLWSLHVDNHPGDRACSCQGLMEPQKVFYQSDQWKIIHRCQKCGQEKTVKTKPQDSQATIEKIIEKSLKE